jgi:hypothetical protein
MGGHAKRGEVAGREVGGRGAAAAQAACTGEGRPKAVGGQGTRGAHLEHPSHVRDLGGIKAQRLVEGVRVLEHGEHVRDLGGVKAQRLVEGVGLLPS